MSDRGLAVLDASIGVKWMKPEAGTADAESLLAEHRAGIRRIVVSELFVTELISTAVRVGGVERGELAWAMVRDADVMVLPLDDALASAAFAQCEALGCTFYDALAPALADVLGATLYTSDRRAHAAYPGVVLV